MNRTRPSLLAVVACLALAVALAGTTAGYAAGKASGNSLIKKHSVSANLLKADSVTGSQVNESTLGTVPRAALAQSLPAPAFVGLSLDPGWLENLSGGTRQVGYRKDAGGFVHLQGRGEASAEPDRRGHRNAPARLPAERELVLPGLLERRNDGWRLPGGRDLLRGPVSVSAPGSRTEAEGE
jgi:hypothetical protein